MSYLLDDLIFWMTSLCLVLKFLPISSQFLELYHSPRPPPWDLHMGLELNTFRRNAILVPSSPSFSLLPEFPVSANCLAQLPKPENWLPSLTSVFTGRMKQAKCFAEITIRYCTRMTQTPTHESSPA